MGLPIDPDDLPPDLVAGATIRGVDRSALGEVPPEGSPPRRRKQGEAAFMAAVIAIARVRGWLVYHTHDSRRSVAGFPDLVLIRGDTLIVAELKVGKNTTTSDQEKWLSAFRECGVRAEVWRPEDWPEIERVLGGENV